MLFLQNKLFNKLRLFSLLFHKWFVLYSQSTNDKEKLEKLIHLTAGQRDGRRRRQPDALYIYTYGVPYMDAANGRVWFAEHQRAPTNHTHPLAE